MARQCLITGGRFQLPVSDISRFDLYGYSLFNPKHFLYSTTISFEDQQTNLDISVFDESEAEEKLREFYTKDEESSAWQVALMTVSSSIGWGEMREMSISVYPLGKQILLVDSHDPQSRLITVVCVQETNYWSIFCLCVGFFLLFFHPILAHYEATTLLGSAIIGMLFGIVIPAFYFLNNKAKFVLMASYSSIMSYFALYYWEFIFHRYFITYEIICAIIGIWFGNGKHNPKVLNGTMILICLVLFGNCTPRLLQVNIYLIAFAVVFLILQWTNGLWYMVWGCGRCYRSLKMAIGNMMGIDMRPKKKMLTPEQYKQNCKDATKAALDDLRLYYLRTEDW
eukprot:CAMPEP_0174257058 /NCGR_PEP_ID=MMETSP0439-20130205/6231_1 /TAXON_ID=0 /ORGANISM="Stereomyxa ramosa, Strain Chinc5" /LENGTH=338 /DNA_ID=CAMNT_0015339961 /DNA_START=120 /DNA_END=1133 /DNA_ORIENTATION=+